MIANRRNLILEMQEKAVRLQNRNRVEDIAFLLRDAVELTVTDLLKMNYYEAKAETMHEIILEMHECGLISDNERDALSTANYWGNSGYHNNGASFTVDESMLALEQCLSIYDCHFEKYTEAEQHEAKEALEMMIKIKTDFDRAADDYNEGENDFCISSLRKNFNAIVESLCDIYGIKKTKEDGSRLKSPELLEELRSRYIISQSNYYDDFRKFAKAKVGHRFSAGTGDVTQEDAKHALSLFDSIYEDVNEKFSKRWPDVCWEENIGKSKYRIEQERITQERITQERIEQERKLKKERSKKRSRILLRITIYLVAAVLLAFILYPAYIERIKISVCCAVIIVLLVRLLDKIFAEGLPIFIICLLLMLILALFIL